MGGGMTLLLSGTNGLSDVDGSAATPAIRGTDANTGMFFPAADTIAFAEGGTESMRLDSSGNLGLGVTPSAWQSGRVAFQIQRASAGGGISLHTAATTQGVFAVNAYFNGTNDIYTGNGAASAYSQFNSSHSWFTAPTGTAGNAISFTQAMTLDATGRLLIAKTAINDDTVPGTVIAERINHTTSNGATMLLNRHSSDGDSVIIRRNNVTVGSISVTTSATSYNTSSDYRLKNTVAPMTGALAKVALLKPVTYKWNVDGSDGQGFIAHELQAVVPDAVIGEKDAVDAEGKPVYQGIDTSFLVATLTAAIQEQQAMIEQLKADVAALKGTV
jgi:hypothetical protein